MSKKHIDGWFDAIDKQREFVKENFRGRKLKELNQMISHGFKKAKTKLLENINKYEKGSRYKKLQNYLIEKYQKKFNTFN
jgi:hypothetical protein